MFFFFFFFKQKTAYEIRLSLVGSEMCIETGWMHSEQADPETGLCPRCAAVVAAQKAE